MYPTLPGQPSQQVHRPSCFLARGLLSGKFKHDFYEQFAPYDLLQTVLRAPWMLTWGGQVQPHISTPLTCHLDLKRKCRTCAGLMES